MIGSTLSWNTFTERLPWWAGSLTTVAILGAFTVYSIFIVFFQPVAESRPGKGSPRGGVGSQRRPLCMSTPIAPCLALLRTIPTSATAESTYLLSGGF